jgi:hypothetical protein
MQTVSGAKIFNRFRAAAQRAKANRRRSRHHGPACSNAVLLITLQRIVSLIPSSNLDRAAIEPAIWFSRDYSTEFFATI